MKDPEYNPAVPVIGETNADAVSKFEIPTEVFGYSVLLRRYLNLS